MEEIINGVNRDRKRSNQVLMSRGREATNNEEWGQKENQGSGLTQSKMKKVQEKCLMIKQMETETLSLQLGIWKL